MDLTMNEVMDLLFERVATIEKSGAPALPDDFTALQRWNNDLKEAAERLGKVLADVSDS